MRTSAGCGYYGAKIAQWRSHNEAVGLPETTARRPTSGGSSPTNAKTTETTPGGYPERRLPQPRSELFRHVTPRNHREQLLRRRAQPLDKHRGTRQVQNLETPGQFKTRPNSQTREATLELVIQLTN